MTPKMLAPHLFIASKRRVREMSELLAMTALGTSGDGKKIQRQLKRWAREL